jgi:glyoxylase-like metal-dependent hydrolase (beta-lactamase superfamily II)
MFDFENYQSAYLVEGKELALIDTGLPNQYETVRRGIAKHGFSIMDIDHIFITHCEHPDHSGNAGNIVRDNRKAKLHIHPAGAICLTDPSIEEKKRKAKLKPQMATRFGTMIPVPQERIETVNDGDTFNLGNDVKLRIIYAPGHQPSGFVVYEEKHNGLFINDLVGNYFPDANDFILTLNPYGAEVKKAMESLRMLKKLPIRRLFLGHFGIHEEPQKVIDRALADMQQLMDIGQECLAAGKPEEIIPRVLAHKMPETEKLKLARGNELYEYTRDELNTHHAEAFSEYYQREFS